MYMYKGRRGRDRMVHVVNNNDYIEYINKNKYRCDGGLERFL